MLVPQACPRLVPLVELGMIDGPEVESALLEYLVPMRAARVDTLILGCTHYPFLAGAIRRILGPRVAIVDPARETACDGKTVLAGTARAEREGSGSRLLCFSDITTAARRLARELPGGTSAEFEQVVMQDFAHGTRN